MATPSRDSIGWWFGLVGGVSTAILASSDLLEIPHAANLWLLRISVVIAAVSGWMKTSPLPSKQGAAVANAAAKYIDAKRELASVQETIESKMPDVKPVVSDGVKAFESDERQESLRRRKPTVSDTRE